MAEPVRSKEEQAQAIAHLLDDAFRLPRIGMRFGLDPILGLLPLIGDGLTTVLGMAILLLALQLRAPADTLGRIAYNLALNGLIGTIPGFGDAFSFWFKSNAKNAALLLRGVARGKGDACPITAKPLGVSDIIIALIIAGPIVALVGYASFSFWERGITLSEVGGCGLPAIR
jgi:hypothetical protein